MCGQVFAEFSVDIEVYVIEMRQISFFFLFVHKNFMLNFMLSCFRALVAKVAYIHVCVMFVKVYLLWTDTNGFQGFRAAVKDIIRHANEIQQDTQTQAFYSFNAEQIEKGMWLDI